MHSSPPRISASTYIALRPENGVLTLAAIRRTPWRIDPGARVIISIYGLRSVEAGAAEQIGRILSDAGAGDVFLQASTSSRLVEELRASIDRAARAYWASQS